ncbi:hypothetical protein S83_055509 [Arachis hypogaea]
MQRHRQKQAASLLAHSRRRQLLVASGSQRRCLSFIFSSFHRPLLASPVVIPPLIATRCECYVGDTRGKAITS